MPRSNMIAGKSIFPLGKTNESESVSGQGRFKIRNPDDEKGERKKPHQSKKSEKDMARDQREEQSDEEENTKIPTRKESSDKTEERREQVNICIIELKIQFSYNFLFHDRIKVSSIGPE